jgi:mannose/cellobiose epimerase-like protein (N-acyl-D-glucosamine 2-epimerase family)
MFDEVHKGNAGPMAGMLEFIIKDKNGDVVDRIIDRNLIKIHAKEFYHIACHLMRCGTQ